MGMSVYVRVSGYECLCECVRERGGKWERG